MQQNLRPKVICKNLDDLIKESMYSTKRNSIQDMNRKQQSQRILKSEPRQRQKYQRCNTAGQSNNNLLQSTKRMNTSMSKHSLKSKQKINFTNINHKNLKSNLNIKNFSSHPQKQLTTQTVSQFYSIPNKKSRKNTLSFGQTPPLHTQSLYFNQIDAIFTDLQDFLRQTRDKICVQVDFMNQQNLSNTLINQLTNLSNIFKQQIQKVLQRRSSHFQIQTQVLKPKNFNSFNLKIDTKCLNRETSNKKLQQKQVFSKEELMKIQQFMQRQNTINSTINSEAHQDAYLPTQTDAELLSMLVFKNKVNSTKRKIQNTYNHGQQLLTAWPKSGRNNGNQGQYSFRKGNNTKEKQAINNNDRADFSNKKKKNQHLVTQKSYNKQNRQKSIYQIVLQENKRSKGNWLK